MNSKVYGAWFQVGMDAWSLGMEASTVMCLRMTKLTAGGAGALGEAELMVSEKVQAAVELQTALIGATPLTGTQKALRHYRRKVAANRRRLRR